MNTRSWLGIRSGISALALGLATAALTATTAVAQPINGSARWCATMSHFGGTLECNYHSLEQCMAGASGVSNQCSLNPWYAGGPEEPRRRKRDLRR